MEQVEGCSGDGIPFHGEGGGGGTRPEDIIAAPGATPAAEADLSDVGESDFEKADECPRGGIVHGVDQVVGTCGIVGFRSGGR